jgi:ATP-dependent Clp protease adaptor protein ClpS
MYAALVEALVLLLGAFGATGALWTLQARARLREDAARAKQIATWLDEEMQIALALAKHAASSRHQPFAPIHVLYALVQAESVAAGIRTLGGDLAAIEAAIDTALDRVPPAGDAAAGDPREGNKLLGAALGLARAHDREMTLADTLNQLAHTPLAALLAAPPVSTTALLFQLVHGEQPPMSLFGETHVHVVLRNDDYTTQELVVSILRDVFELPADRATAVMRDAHEHKRAIVGRFAAEAAEDKIETARRRAVADGSPLWLGVEVC